MSPILALFLSMMLIQAAPDAVPAAAPAPPPEDAPTTVSMDNDYPVPQGAPSDDYGLVAWCYGALSGHMGLYDKVIGDVEIIEIEIGKIPGAPPADMNSYRLQREAGKDTLKQFRKAMEAAEKASPRPIATYGAESLKKGGSIWINVRSGDKKYLAREWMSWGLPGRCLPTAERLEAKSALFGQALSYNIKPAAPSPPSPEAVDAATFGAGEAAPADDAPMDAAPATVGEAAADESAVNDAAEADAAAMTATEPPKTDTAAGDLMSDTAPDDVVVAEPDSPSTADGVATPTSVDDLLPGEAPDEAVDGVDAVQSAETPPADSNFDGLTSNPAADEPVATDPAKAEADETATAPTSVEDLLLGEVQADEASDEDAASEPDDEAETATGLRGPL